MKTNTNNKTQATGVEQVALNKVIKIIEDEKQRAEEILDLVENREGARAKELLSANLGASAVAETIKTRLLKEV